MPIPTLTLSLTHPPNRKLNKLDPALTRPATHEIHTHHSLPLLPPNPAVPHKTRTEDRAQTALVPAFRTASLNKPFVALFFVYLVLNFSSSLTTNISTYSLHVSQSLGDRSPPLHPLIVCFLLPKPGLPILTHRRSSS